jgi:biopolymer transport protein ExbD
MSINVGKSGGLNAEINVTPLVDVMLVLLIIMMLVAPMLQKGVDVKLPEAGNTVDKPENQEQTVVAVDAANRLWVNGVQVAKHEFADRVRAALEDRSERVVLIKGDQDASYGAIMEAMDFLHEAEIEDIGLITDPRPEPNKPQGGN